MRVAQRRISIRLLKRWALGVLSSGAPLRGLLLSYPDECEGEAFLHLIPTWLQLLSQFKGESVANPADGGQMLGPALLDVGEFSDSWKMSGNVRVRGEGS